MNPRDEKLPPAPRSSGEIVHALESALLPEESPGVRIGNYKLLQKLGEGGFGVVWMAEQLEPVRRRVALKVIKPGMDTAEVIARFEAERQALALMEHPNIARVFDAGATDAGRPYFVMELVRGVPITRYCDDNRMPAEARLHLFMSVCQAVQHAHQKGVIHRDLKPSNILVTLHDGVAVPKIIDFGIAKATGGARLTDKTLFTQFHAFIGTPAYTSPEQIEMSGLDVDTRSDIYSLGVLLYELLTGRQPFDSAALVKSGLEAMRRTIREIDPPRPSHRLTTLTDAERTTVAQHRSTDAGRLSLLLRGDLDLIVMHCLEKSRTRRYETANGLAMDIGRYLASEPVVARPPSQTYRLQKFVRRHRLAVIAAAAVAVALVAGLVASSVLLVRERIAYARATQAEQAETRLRQQADVARAQETKNASRTALDFAGQLLERGQVADALAYLVYAAQKDPANATIAPRLASVLTSHNFLIPEGAPFQCGSGVPVAQYTADGKSIYVGTADGTFRILDAASGMLKREIHLGKKVKRHGWTFADKNEPVMAVTFVDNTIGLFEVKSGHPLWPPIQLDEDTFPDGGASFGPDNRWLIAHGLYCFWIWDAASGKEVIKQSFDAWYSGPVFNNDGTRLAFIAQAHVHCLSFPECQPSFEAIPLRPDFVPAINASVFSYSPDGRKLVVTHPQQGVYVFDATNGHSLRPMMEMRLAFKGFSPDGRLFAPGEKTWDLLDITTGKLTSLSVLPGSSGGRANGANIKMIVTTFNDGVPQLRETMAGRFVTEPRVQQLDTFVAAVSPDEAQVALGTGAGAVLRLRVGRGAARPLALHEFPVLNTYPIPFLNRGGPPRLLWFKDDHAVALDVASGLEVAGGFAYPPSDPPLVKNDLLQLHVQRDLKYFVLQDWTGHRTPEVWENTGAGIRRVGILQGAPDVAALVWGYFTTAFSPKGDLVAREKGPREIGVWDLHTGAPVGPGCSYRGQLLADFPWMAFSADGKRLACGTNDGKCVVWDVASGQVVTVIETQSDISCSRVLFSPDGTRLHTVSGRGEARLWKIATGEPCSPAMNGVDEASFSADGRWFSSMGSFGIQIRDGKNGALVCEISRREGFVLLSPTGGRVGISVDGNAQVWDILTGQPVTEVMRECGGVFDWSLDGRYVLTGHGIIKVFSVPPPLPEGTPNPPWLLQLATICGARKVNEAGQCVDAPEVAAQIGDVRRQLAALPDDSPYVEWGRWILDDSPTRSIAPGFTITPADADKLEAEGEEPAAPK